MILGGATLGSATFGYFKFRKPFTLRKLTGEVESSVYRALNGKPVENLSKVIEMMGGIEKLIGPDDIVLIKPNGQWWNQGAPNLSALKVFVDLIMERPGGFRGEVVIVENSHRGRTPWTSSSAGWANKFQRNSGISDVNNMNDLSDILKKKYGSRFSTVHWIDVDDGGKRVFSPADGDGYVFCDGTGGVPFLASTNNMTSGKELRTTIMTYPIFTTDNGTKVDFKYGVWGKGRYTGQPLRFINLAALNHHSYYCGATSAIKNYMGVTDLSGGPDPHNKGLLTGKYYNFHSFPFDKWSPGPEPGMLGRAIGSFMEMIRKADLNITTAEWVGLSSRTDLPVALTRAVLASSDPVALDYHATKYILYQNSNIKLHDPDVKDGPLRAYLVECAKEGAGILDEKHVKIISYDFKSKAIQSDSDLAIIGDKEWGRNPKGLIKYLIFRFKY